MIRLDDFARLGFMIRLPGMECCPMRESAERAEYIGEIAAGMARIARDGNLNLLAFILDMAALEARRSAESLSAEPVEHRPPLEEPCHR
jgi:hypothetical protein